MGGPRLVQWSRFSDAFQRLFGLQGSTSLNVVDDVFLTLPAEEELLHLSYLRGWKAWGIDANAGAVAGQLSRVHIQNVGPGYLVVIEGISIFATVAQRAQLQIIGSLAAGATRAGARDGRLNPGFGLGLVGPVSANTFSAAGPAVTVPIHVAPVAATVPATVLTDGWVLQPGADLAVEGMNVNTDIRVSAWGKYRELTPQEV